MKACPICSRKLRRSAKMAHNVAKAIERILRNGEDCLEFLPKQINNIRDIYYTLIEVRNAEVYNQDQKPRRRTR